MFRRFCDPFVKKYNQIKEFVNRKECIFSEDELADYQQYTFLTKTQIKTVYLLFCSLDPEVVENQKNPSLSHDKIIRMPELWLNPFKDRILKTFSIEPGVMCFEEFLEMMSIFSSKAPRKIKTEYAFRIYDFDDDDMIGPDDLQELLKRLKGRNEFNTEDSDAIVENILVEGDVDGDGFITFPEFKHLMKKCPDFVHSFRIRI